MSIIIRFISFFMRINFLKIEVIFLMLSEVYQGVKM